MAKNGEAKPRKRGSKQMGPSAFQRIRESVVARRGVHLTPAETAELYWRANLGPLALADDEKTRPPQLGLGDVLASPAVEVPMPLGPLEAQ